MFQIQAICADSQLLLYEDTDDIRRGNWSLKMLSPCNWDEAKTHVEFDYKGAENSSEAELHVHQSSPDSLHSRGLNLC